MKRQALIFPIVYLLICAMVMTVVAAGGDASDPLASLSYLNGTFTSTVDAGITQRLDASDQTLENVLAQKQSGGTAAASVADTWRETRLKAGDALSGATGLNVLVLAGSVSVAFSSGAVVDVSAGTTLPSGTLLTAKHRYLVAEDTSAVFTVTSQTAVVDYMGGYAFTYSGAVDYNAMASALKTMHLFKGSFTGYGSGYDLEAAPTRLQALIMFIRVLGEEDAALAYTGTAPFADLTAGSSAAKYVGYAVEKGYTNGYTATQWKPAQAVNVYQYTEFMLRALGYSSTANTDLSGTMDKALACGVLTSGEISLFKSSPFLRAQLVYISFYGLDAAVSDGSGTLRSLLISKGVFTSAESAAASALVTGGRVA